MLATGGLLIAVGLLMLALFVPMFRRSDPPQWTTRGWIGELVTVGLVSTLSLGLACFVAGAIDAFRASPDPLDLGLLAVVLIASIAIWRRFKASTRPKAVAPPARTDVAASGSVRSDGTAEPLPGAASEPPPPHKAA
jgi:hypothetical protein